MRIECIGLWKCKGARVMVRMRAYVDAHEGLHVRTHVQVCVRGYFVRASSLRLSVCLRKYAYV